MFSLIVTIISIALVAMLALATLYYGGAAFTKGIAEAQSAKVRIQGQQLLGAAELYQADTGDWPASLSDLTPTYLKSLPEAKTAVDQALANGNSWTMPLPRVPLFLVETPQIEACRKTNEAGYGKTGILSSVVSNVLVQCYGSPAQLFTMAAKNSQGVQALLTAGASVAADPSLAAAYPDLPSVLPSALVAGAPASLSDPAWTVAPDAPVQTGLGAPGGTGGAGSSGGGTSPLPAPTVALSTVAGADFGGVPQGSAATRQFTFYNQGPTPAMGLAIDVTGSFFAVTSDKCTGGTLAAGSSCTFSVEYAPTTQGAHEGTVTVASNALNGAQSLALTAQSTDPISYGAWSGSQSSQTAPPTTFGGVNQGASSERYVYVRPTGTGTSLISGYVLTGATSQFQLLSVERLNGLGMPADCGSVVTGSQASACTGTESNPVHRIRIRYAPTQMANHSITLTPAAGLNTSMPGALTLTGNGLDPQAVGVWASSGNASDNFPSNHLTLQPLGVGDSRASTFILRRDNTTTVPLAASYVLTGDVSQFSFTQVIGADRNQNARSCASPVTFSATADQKQSTECRNIEGSGGLHHRITLAYTPTRPGSHTVTLTAVPGVGTAVPQPLTLTGTAVQGVGVFSGTWDAIGPVPPLSSAVGLPTTNYVYLHNTNLPGRLVTGYTLTGDTSQFSITAVEAMTRSAIADACGSTITNGHTASTCTAEASGEVHQRVTLRYTPTSEGPHFVTLTPTGSDYSIVPAPITIRGDGLRSTGAWSGAAGSQTALPTAMTASPGSRTTLTAHIRRTSSSGRLASGYTLTGDTSQFSITQVQRVSNRNSAGPCDSTITNGHTASTCAAEASGQVHHRIDIRYAPTSAGSHSVTLTPTGSIGSTMPAPLVFTGTAP